MAAKESGKASRVTQVDPWIFGGEGRLVDLFPLPPWLILFGRFLSACIRHPIRSLIVFSTIYLYFSTDSYFVLLVPLLAYLLISAIHIGNHWYHSPEVQLIRRKR